MQQAEPPLDQPGGMHGSRLVVHHQRNMKENLQLLGYTRTFSALVAGIVTGILGVTGFKGFLLFIALQLLNAGAMFVKCGFNPNKYYVGWAPMFVSGLMSQTELLTFILFWTLSNNLVYLF